MERPILLPNPVSDTEFVDFMRTCAVGADTPEDLQQRLRANYPKAVVRLRVIVGEQHVTWYVYRDGRWVPDAGQLGRRS